MIQPKLIAAGIIAVASAGTGFGAAWKIQSWRMDAREKQHVERELENQRLVAKTQTRQDLAIITAQNEGQARATRLRVASDAARTSADGLRDQIARTVRDSNASLAACTVRTVALGELLAAATESHTKLAAAADRHASDLRLMIEAWPR